MRLILAQLNPLIGDLRGNATLIKSACQKATQLKGDLLITPELSLWGYPPRDLLLDSRLIDEQKLVLDELSKTISRDNPGLSVLVGLAERIEDIQFPSLFNSIALVKDSGWEVIARKQLLPTYDVFDEKRYFRAGNSSNIIKFKYSNQTLNIGITICEDIWVEESIHDYRLVGPDPIGDLIPKNIDLLINLSASPFSIEKEKMRMEIATKAIRRLKCPLVYLNQVGSNDELIFDGTSFVLDHKAKPLLRLSSFNEEIALWDTTKPTQNSLEYSLSFQEKLFKALVLGVRDYTNKCGFKTALIGLSGGIDSALVALIATAALGADKVTAVLMPSPWNSNSSTEDAVNLAKRLGIKTHTVPIADLMQNFDSALTESLGKTPDGITAENLQSRIRGTLLMAFANQNKHLLLSTGNKSELAVGYCTLYGDMNGGLSVIGDLYKTYVFELCKWLDSKEAQTCRESMGLPFTGDIIGKNIINKPPSAELRPGQKDSDSLPPYSILDPILQGFIEERLHPDELIKTGKDAKTVTAVLGMVKSSEFKRRQAPPLLKVSQQAFGSGWRIPIASK